MYISRVSFWCARKSYVLRFVMHLYVLLCFSVLYGIYFNLIVLISFEILQESRSICINWFWVLLYR